MRRIKQLGEPIGGFLCGTILLLILAKLYVMWAVDVGGMLP